MDRDIFQRHCIGISSNCKPDTIGLRDSIYRDVLDNEMLNRYEYKKIFIRNNRVADGKMPIVQLK